MFTSSNGILFDFLEYTKCTHIIVLSSSELVTVVFFKNWSKNLCLLSCDLHFGDNWYLAIIGPRLVSLSETKGPRVQNTKFYCWKFL